MALKNRLILRFLALWKKIFPANTPDDAYPRYLIVSTTGLGDTLWATPSLKTLKKSEPQSYIAVLTTPLGKEILETNPYIDKIYVLKKSLRLLMRLRQDHLQTAIILHASQRMALPLCFLSGVSRIVGTKGINKGLDCLLTDPDPPRAVHEIERRLELIRRVRSPLLVSQHLELFCTAEDEQKQSEFLHPLDCPSYIPIIGIHPGAKDRFKQWPPELYIELANRLRETLGCQILFTGSPNERPLLKTLQHSVPHSHICAELNVRPFASLLKKMSLFIVGDTGTAHLAFAMNTPTVCLFTPTDPKICGPYLAHNVAILKKPPTCFPCLRKQCQKPFCLLQISPEEVFLAAMKLFHSQER